MNGLLCRLASSVMGVSVKLQLFGSWTGSLTADRNSGPNTMTKLLASLAAFTALTGAAAAADLPRR
ncbi:hypothetical protein FV228_14305, partial [Methylobacterium sp. WL18]|uniref:hypothetical protein n=1 Tax=Methylobacterium sp. WL18 TaxID=2603897 RepID=UPI0011C89BEB